MTSRRLTRLEKRHVSKVGRAFYLFYASRTFQTFRANVSLFAGGAKPPPDRTLASAEPAC
jgi:hypothetical protein